MPFYYGYYSSKWGRLGEGSSDSSDARDVLNWIKGGNDISGDQASKPILPVNIHSSIERRDRTKLLDDSTLKDNQVTFGQKQYRMHRPVSPKTNGESETNFDEFINRLERKRRLSQDSDREKSQTESRNGSREVKTGSGNKKGGVFRQKLLGNRHDESDILRFSTDRSVDNLKVSSNKKENGQTVLDDIFSVRKDKRNSSVERPREENSSASNRKKYQEDLFLNERLRSLDIGSDEVRPGIVKLKPKPKSSRTDNPSDSHVEADGEKQVKSSRPLVVGGKSSLKRLAFSALNINKFSKAVPLALVRKAFQDLVRYDEEVKRAREKNRQMHEEVRYQEGLHQLHMFFNKRSWSLLRAAFQAMAAVKKSQQHLQPSFELMERINGRFKKQGLALAFGKILSHLLQYKAAHATPLERMVDLLDKRRREGGRATSKQAVADGLDNLKRIMLRKDMRCTHDIRRYLLRWRLSCNGGQGLAAGLNKLQTYLEAKHKAHALRGFYSIQASGGRLDKLYIVANRKEKIYLAKLKYCFKKLRIWNRFRSGGTEAITNVRTIIIRTADPIDEQRNANLTRMFKRKGFENLLKTFVGKQASHVRGLFALLKDLLDRGKRAKSLLSVLHSWLHRKRLQKAWVEINIYILQKNSVESVTETLKGSINFSPYSKKRDKTAEKHIRKVKNPMFQFIEENHCNSDHKGSSESLTLSHSNELEIFKTGLDLDTRLSQHLLSRLKTSSSSLEQILKSDERFGKSKVFMKFHRIRQLIVKLTSLYKKKLRISFARIGRAASTQKMSSLSDDYKQIGLTKLHKTMNKMIHRRLVGSLAAIQPRRPKSRQLG